MRIGTLGNGMMAEALATHWVKAGHQVMIGGRDPGRAARVAERVGGTSGLLAEAASYGDVALLAVPAEVAVETARLVPPGRTLIDCTNADVDVVAQLVRDVGCEPIAAGGLARAKLLEATAALAIGIWATGGDARTMFPPLAAAFGTVSPG